MPLVDIFMSINNMYSMTDEAIAKEMGGRVEQLRLEANISQEAIASELGVTRVTYRKLIDGKGKFQLLIGVLRVLDQLSLLENFIPERSFSPLALLEMQGKQRQRASSAHQKTPVKDEDLGW